MPFFLMLLILFGVAYQLFFRFDQWPDSQRPGVVMERDNLTGQTQAMLPGTARQSLIARVSGLWGQATAGMQTGQESLAMAGVEASANRSVSTVTDSSTAAEQSAKSPSTQQTAATPPLPDALPEAVQESVAMIGMAASPVVNQLTQPRAISVQRPQTVFAYHANDWPADVTEKNISVDLNGDGIAEVVMVRKSDNDGLLDVSVLHGVRRQQELFYGRIRRLDRIPGERGGWGHLGIVGAGGKHQVLHFNPDRQSYEPDSVG